MAEAAAPKIKEKKRPKLMAVIIEEGCTGCEVCIDFCPVPECIVPIDGPDPNNPKFAQTVRVVDDLDAAIAHIRAHGSGLAEAIVTRDYARARRFVAEVDAACVLVNASTRLCDGQQFGMGAELGISTSKLHARGPVGVEELTTTKFVVMGSGQLRE